jgi:23S rRNA (uracil1939-C5)-methyltransferase
MQHLSSDRYVAWKAGILDGALSQHGIAANVAPMVSAGLGTRRRANFGAKRGPHGVLLGFHEPRGHRILDLAECPILSPEIANRLPALRTLLDAVLPRNTGLRLIVTVVANGVDVVIEGAGTAPTPGQREAIAAAAREARLLRVSLDRDPIYVAGEPVLRFGTVDVVPPPGVFLQAVPEIDAAMARTIVNALGKKAKRVADLFCGLGNFTLPLATRAREVVDATGAGDAFAGGFLAGLVTHGDVGRSLEQGIVSASFAIEDWGGRGLMAATLAAAAERQAEWFADAPGRVTA